MFTARNIKTTQISVLLFIQFRYFCHVLFHLYSDFLLTFFLYYFTFFIINLGFLYCIQLLKLLNAYS